MVDEDFPVTTEACVQRTIRVETSNDAVASVACYSVVIPDTSDNDFAIGLYLDVPASVLVAEVSDLPAISTTETCIQRTVSVVTSKENVAGCVTPLAASDSDDLSVVLDDYGLVEVVVIEMFDCFTVTGE